jgi:hypothetical protein
MEIAMPCDALRTHLQLCLERFTSGTLTEADLRQSLTALDSKAARQDLLYIQAENSHPGSRALGMSMVIAGRAQEPPVDAERWPYQSALEALQDGWRIISFPNLSILLDGATPHGLGCEFILERWSTS